MILKIRLRIRTLACLTMITSGTLAFGVGCTTLAKKSPSDSEVSAVEHENPASWDSALDITYQVGHGVYQFSALSRNKDGIVGKEFLDHQLLREAQIDPVRYQELFKRALQFVTSCPRKPAASLASNATCRAPFTVKIRHGESNQVLEGCRSDESGGMLSKITHDAEFLLYSRK